ncbi:MAG: threonine/serine dehydratase [Chlamydiales bacterium]|nr:threonine/serine dehydratase [Chlamydiales bacterium]
MTHTTLRELNSTQFKQYYETISHFLDKTPLLRFSSLEKKLKVGQRIFLKCENSQVTGSFKIRAAYGALASLSKEERDVGVVSRSSGNFGQALAYASREQNIFCHIVVPTNCPEFKVNKIKSYTDTVTIKGATHQEGYEYVNSLVARDGLSPLSPYNHYGVMLANGSLAFEVLQDCPNISTLFAPVGGGGLMAGISSVMKLHNPACQMIAVEPRLANDFQESFSQKSLLSKDGLATIADGLRAPHVGEKEWPILLKNVDHATNVTEDEIRLAMKLLYQELKIVAEPSGATALAGLIASANSGLLQESEGDIVVVISGGNIAPEDFFSLI